MEKFNPSNPKYKKVADLPRARREKFVDVETGGFVRKSADEIFFEAEKEAVRNEDVVVHEYGRRLPRENNPQDILQEQAVDLENYRKVILTNPKKYFWLSDDKREQFFRGDDFLDDKEVMMQVLKHVRDAGIIRKLSPRLQQDREVILAALRGPLSNGDNFYSYSGGIHHEFKAAQLVPQDMLDDPEIKKAIDEYDTPDDLPGSA